MDNSMLGGLLMLVFVIGFYAYVSYALQSIANKIGTPNAWFAWVPVLNLYLMVKMAGKPWWWFLLYLLPIVQIVILIIVWMRIAEAVGKSKWLGLLMLLTPVNLFVLGYLAFWDSGSGSVSSATTAQGADSMVVPSTPEASPVVPVETTSIPLAPPLSFETPSSAQAAPESPVSTQADSDNIAPKI